MSPKSVEQNTGRVHNLMQSFRVTNPEITKPAQEPPPPRRDDEPFVMGEDEFGITAMPPIKPVLTVV